MKSLSYQHLNELNIALVEMLQLIDETPAENENSDDLVLKLHDLVSKRQILLNELIDDESMTDRDYLDTQLLQTQEFIQQVQKMMQHRHDLLLLGQKSRRQINVYKNIDSDR